MYMVRVYDLKKVQGLEVLTCSVFPNGENAPCLIINAATDFSWIELRKIPSTSVTVVREEVWNLYTFLEGKHWRDTVKHQRDRVDSLFEMFRCELAADDSRSGHNSQIVKPVFDPTNQEAAK